MNIALFTYFRNAQHKHLHDEDDRNTEREQDEIRRANDIYFKTELMNMILSE